MYVYMYVFLLNDITETFIWMVANFHFAFFNMSQLA